MSEKYRMAASTSWSSPVARTSRSRPRPTATYSRATARAVSGLAPWSCSIAATRATQYLLDHALKHGCCPRAALQRLAVDLEEQPLLGRQLRAAQMLPEAVRHFPGHLAGLAAQRTEGGALAALDRPDDFDEQALPGTEVVDEHAMACPGGLGDSAQALVGDPSGQRHADHGLKQLFLRGWAGGGAGRCARHVPNGTPLSMEHRVTTAVSAPPEQIWLLFVDVERWPEMTESISEVRRLDSGPLRVGSEAIVKQPRLPRARWRVTELEPGRCFTWETTNGGTTAVGGHTVAASGQGSQDHASPSACAGQRPG